MSRSSRMISWLFRTRSSFRARAMARCWAAATSGGAAAVAQLEVREPARLGRAGKSRPAPGRCLRGERPSVWEPDVDVNRSEDYLCFLGVLCVAERNTFCYSRIRSVRNLEG